MSQRRLRVKLIFNPSAGAARGTKIQLQDVIHELQAWQFEPEAYLVKPGCDLSEVVRNALAQGIRLFVVCGGDGTLLAVAGRQNGHDHGAHLARGLGYTPVYLHYNTGLRVSTNGKLLAELLQRLAPAWPEPVEEIALLGHSMGGLVARSARRDDPVCELLVPA